jgi:protein-tyrosine phosphatase
MKKLKTWEIIKGKLYQSPQFWRESLDWKRIQLDELNIDAVVCLTKVVDKHVSDRYKDKYVYLHIPDGKTLAFDKLLQESVRVGNWLEEGLKVLVHCQAGRNRSSLFSALLCIRCMEISGAESVQHLRKCRKNALGNPVFSNFLEKIERYSRVLSSYIYKG